MYDHIAPSYNELHGAEQRRKLETLLEHITIPPDATVLDIGCGTAHLATYFSKQIYLGIDPSQPLLNQALTGTHVLCARGEHIPLQEQFDIILSLTTLHNYENWEQGINEIERLAKNLILVGILKKAKEHDAILITLKKRFSVQQMLDDRHDTLLILRKP